MGLFGTALPLGAEALHPDWPDARFNLSGLFVYDAMVVDLIEIMQEVFECRLPIDSMHGSPSVLWNAGRPARVPFDRADVQGRLEKLCAKGVGCFPTFSNHLLEKSDLGDSASNYFLDCIAQRPDINGVIVTSDLLSSYIAGKYPKLRQIASITKVTMEQGQGRFEYYQKLGKRFSRYVVHPDDGRNAQLLDQLDRGKAEIILNENCVVNCANRAHHYDVHARWQKTMNAQPTATSVFGINPATEREFMELEARQTADRCVQPAKLKGLRNRKRNCNLTRSEVKAIYAMGYRTFKLQGRDDDLLWFFYDLTRYMLEPEVVAPIVLKMLLRRNAIVVLADGDPRLGNGAVARAPMD